jgi:pimeloyl-ACP methyl ester carboxylesterase
VREGALAGFAIDAARVALVGHSLGGFAALRAAAADPGVRAAATDAGVPAVAADPGVRVAAADLGVRPVAADPGVRVAAADPGVRAVVALAPFDLGAAGGLAAADPARRAAYVRDFDGELLPLRGTSGAALVAEMVAAAADWRLDALAERLAGRPVLLVGGRRDTVAEPDVHFRPLLRSYAANPALEHALLDTDHALSDRRVAMIRIVAGFLSRVLPVG